MKYNVNFCIVSLAFLSVTAFFYTRQAKIPSRRARLFNAMLLCCLLSLALDITAACMDESAYLLSPWFVYGVNIVFLLSVQLSGVLFFMYCINLTGAYRRMSLMARSLVLLPLVLVAAALFSSPFTGWIFYLDGSNTYHHGGLHLMLYAVMGLYIASSAVIVFLRRKALGRKKLFTILGFLLATVTAMIVQMNMPYLLVNSMANAVAITLMYHVLEAPGVHQDALTEVLNRTALSPLLGDMFDEGVRCTALVYTLNALHLVNRSFGMKGGDKALAAFAGYLKREFPRKSILRVEGNIFCVLMAGGSPMDAERLDRLWAGTPSEFGIFSGRVKLDLSLCAVNSDDFKTAAEFTAMLESVIHRDADSGCMLADKSYRDGLLRTAAIEKATQRALDEDRVEVFYQPIHNGQGKLCAIEALVRIRDGELGFLPPQELVELAERNGSITRLGEQVLRRTCEFIRDNGAARWGLDHIGVNLSAIQCVRPQLAEELLRVIGEYDIPPELLAFEITETAAGALATVRENMEKLLDRGLFFLLDDFGTGYANFKNMAALPYRCVKIDKSLLWDAQGSEIRMKLLTGVIKVIHALGLTSLCEGVETREQAELLQSLGVEMLQGYYYSRPLPPQAFIEYVGKAGEC